MNVESVNNKKQKGSVPVVDARNTWVLFDYTQFSISRLRDLELAKLGLTHEQIAILHILYSHGKCTIADIANNWIRQHNSVSSLVDRMAKRGLVEKIKLPKRRQLVINITEKGKRIHNKAKGHSIGTVFSSLSQEDLFKLTQYLTLLFIKSREQLGNNIIPKNLL